MSDDVSVLLLVKPDDHTRDLVQTFANHEGHRVVICADRRDLFSHLERIHTDLVLVDADAPDAART
ncbi:MAG: hypothetical protein HY701_14630, partial [Gemmatimonadetes bacterium]|nr:hypothetical protein [Gemmatimonadota bacterium]